MSPEEHEGKDTLGSLIAKYSEAEKNGERLDLDALTEMHPDLADSLQKLFTNHDRIKAEASLRDATPPSNGIRLDDPTIPPCSLMMQFSAGNRISVMKAANFFSVLVVCLSVVSCDTPRPSGTQDKTTESTSSLSQQSNTPFPKLKSRGAADRNKISTERIEKIRSELRPDEKDKPYVFGEIKLSDELLQVLANKECEVWVNYESDNSTNGAGFGMGNVLEVRAMTLASLTFKPRVTEVTLLNDSIAHKHVKLVTGLHAFEARVAVEGQAEDFVIRQEFDIQADSGIEWNATLEAQHKLEQSMDDKTSTDAETVAEQLKTRAAGKVKKPAFSAVVTPIGKLFTWHKRSKRRQFTDAKDVERFPRVGVGLAAGMVRLGKDEVADGCRYTIQRAPVFPGGTESTRSQHHNFFTWSKHERGGEPERGFRFENIEPGEYLILVGSYGNLFRVDREVIGKNELVRRSLEVDLSKVGKLEVALPDDWKPDHDSPGDGTAESIRRRGHDLTVRVIAAEYRSPPIRLTRLHPFPDTALVDLPTGKFELRCGNSSAVVDVDPGRLKAVTLEIDKVRKRDANDNASMAFYKGDLRRLDVFLRQCKANEAWQEGIAAIKAVQEYQADSYGLLDRERDFLERAGEPDGAAQVEKRLVEVSWDRSSNLNRIASRIAAVDAQDQIDLALKAALRASELEKHQAPAILETVAKVYDVMGKRDEALAWRNRLVQSIWDDAEKLNEFASQGLRRETSHFDDLLVKAILRANEISEEKDPEPLQTLAEVQYKRGNFADALEWQQRLLKLDAADPQDAYRSMQKYLAAWAKSGGAPPMKLSTLDGAGDEWRNHQPIWKEVGVDGGPRIENCDLKRTFIANDEHCLYLFIEIDPPPRVRNAENGYTGAVCKLYLDTDDNPRTGCEGVQGFEYGDIDGYEYLQDVNFGLYRRGDEPGWYVGCKINRVDPKRKGFFFGKEVFSEATFEPNALIAEGDDGLEIAIPLKTLGLKAGDQVRLLIQESADLFARESFSEGRYTVTGMD